MKKTKTKVEKVEKVEKKEKEKLDVSFWSLMLRLSLVFVILASITGIVLSAVSPIHFSFKPYKQAFKLSDQAAKTLFKTNLGSNITFKTSTYKQSGLFLTKQQQEQIVAKFNRGTDISKTDGIEELVNFLGLEYVSSDLLYQDQIVNSSIRLMPIIIDSSKSELDGNSSYSDVTLIKDNENYTALLSHIYIVYLEMKNQNKVNLKKYITFDQTKENIKFNDLLKLAGLSFEGSEDEVINQIYWALTSGITSVPNGHTFNFDSTKIKKESQIKDMFKLNTSDERKAKLWNQLNNLKISINIVPGSEEIIGGTLGDDLISSDYEGDEQGKQPTNHNYKFEYCFDFKVNEKVKTYNYKFIPNHISKPPPPA